MVGGSKSQVSNSPLGSSPTPPPSRARPPNLPLLKTYGAKVVKCVSLGIITHHTQVLILFCVCTQYHIHRHILRTTLSMFYKKRRKIETSPFLNIFCWCYCSIYDVIASLLLNKASKIELVVSYKAFLINHTECSEAHRPQAPCKKS